MSTRSDDVFLVTGGSGFIGTWVLRELLLQGRKVVVYDITPRPDRWQRVIGAPAERLIHVVGSLLDRSKLAATCSQHGVTHFIHLAALLTPACQQDPWSGCEVNVMGSIAMFEQARAQQAQTRGFSYASSLAVYGPELDDDPKHRGANENRPRTFYGAFKQAMERIAEQYWLAYQIPSVGIRPHVVYGPERDQGLSAGPSLAARAVAQGQGFTLSYRGRAGYDYVEDVARGFVRAAMEPPAGAVVVDLPSCSATVDEIIATLDRIVPGSSSRLSIEGPELPANQPPRPRPITELYADWQTTSLEAGLRKTVAFYQPN